MKDPEKPELPTALWERLAEFNPLGMDLDSRDVRDWFDFVWPKYALRGYSDHAKAVTNWFARVTAEDIERSRARAARIRDRSEIARLEAAALEEQEASADVVEIEDHFAKVWRH
jgi:hypothetical protein